MISGIVHSVVHRDMTDLVHLIYSVEEMWSPRADGWYGMRVVA